MSNCWFPVKVPPCQKEASELPVMTTPAPPVLLMAVAPPRSALDCSVTQIPPTPLLLTRKGPAQERLVRVEPPMRDTPAPWLFCTVSCSTVSVLPESISTPFPGPDVPAVVPFTVTRVTRTRDAVIFNP